MGRGHWRIDELLYMHEREYNVFENAVGRQDGCHVARLRPSTTELKKQRDGGVGRRSWSRAR